MKSYNTSPITSPDDVRIRWTKERGKGLYIALALTLDKDSTIDHQVALITIRDGYTFDREAERLTLKRLYDLAAGAFIMQMAVYRVGDDAIKQVYPFADLRLSLTSRRGKNPRGR